MAGNKGFSFSEKYDVILTNIGTFAERAGITKDALEVVYEENVAKRDQVSGVSLDQEAADLVRYQQAYQASKKLCRQPLFYLMQSLQFVKGSK